MADQNRIIILGGHGKIALLALPKLKAAGYDVDAVIRNPDHSDDVRDAGGRPVVLDIEQASHTDLAAAFAGAEAIIFSAGAGGGSPERTRAVDYEAATRSLAAAEEAGVKRFIMVSYVSAATDIHRLDPDNAFYTYAKAKHDADEALRDSSLDYTILGPGRLTLGPASDKLRLVDADTAGDVPETQRLTSRANVASVIAHLVRTGTAKRQTVNFYDGDTPIAEAFES